MKEVTVGVSAPTLVTIPGLVESVIAPIELWTINARFCGYDKLEWRPLNYSVAEAQIREGILSSYSLAMIGSAEQSYRTETSWQEASLHPNKRLAQFSYFYFPHKAESLKNLMSLQYLAPEIPITVYPAENEYEAWLLSGLKNKITQPCPELAVQWGVKSFEDLIVKLDQHGYGINLDLFHIQRLRSLFPLPPEQELVSMMGLRVKEIQYSANRTDFGKVNGTFFEQQLYAGNAQAFNDVMNKSAESEEMKLLLAALTNGFSGPVVTEVLVSKLNPLANIKTHRRISRTLKDLVA